MAPKDKPALDAGADGQHRLKQFAKTKLCKFELLGMCTKGPSCPFAHGQAEMRPLPDLRRTKLCASIVQTGQCDKDDCKFAHAKEELRTTGAFHKTKLCRFEQSGHCSLGARCNFAHTPNEMRPAELEEAAAAQPAPVGLVVPQAGQASANEDVRPAPRRVQFNVPPPCLQLPPGLGGWPTDKAAASAPEGPAEAPGGWLRKLGEPAYVPLPAASGLITDQREHARKVPLPVPGGLIIDQSENLLKATSLPAGAWQRLPPMRTVRTSESTLCTLGDHFEGLEASYGMAFAAQAVPAVR